MQIPEISMFALRAHTHTQRDWRRLTWRWDHPTNHPRRVFWPGSCRFRSRAYYQAFRCLQGKREKEEEWEREWKRVAEWASYVECALANWIVSNASCEERKQEWMSNYVYAPLYQNMLPNSCGPCIILQVRLMSLPVLTIRSLGP